MAHFVKLTDKAGGAVHVNLDLVEYITADRHGRAVLTFRHVTTQGADKVTVQETPDEVAARAAR